MLPLAPLLAAAVGLAAPSALLPGTTWRLSLDVGRHEGVGTWMPAQWGAAGERLQIGSLDVQFLDELCTEVDEPRLNGLGPQEDAYRVRVLTTGTCGDDEVLAMDGAWSRVSKKGRGPTEYRLRFFLEFPNGARRGDVDLGEDRSGVQFRQLTAGAPLPVKVHVRPKSGYFLTSFMLKIGPLDTGILSSSYEQGASWVDANSYSGIVEQLDDPPSEVREAAFGCCS